jgi:hypothetical protein
MADTLAQLIKERVKTWVIELGGEDCLSESGDLLEMSLKSAKALQEKNKLQIMTMPKKEDLAPHLRNVEFNEFLAEPLLREGSLLLDRCLQERKEIEELHTKLFEACIQIQELNELNNITSAEENTYQIAIEIAQAELRSLQNEQVKVEESIDILEKGLLSDASREEKEYLGIDVNQKFTKIEYQTGLLSKLGKESADALAWAQWEEKEYNGGLVRGKAEIYPAYSESYRGHREKSALEIQLSQLKGTNDSLKEKIIIAEKQVELKEKQLEKDGFQRRRNEVSRFIALQRGEQLKKLGGALNFKEQMQRVIERFDNDLQAAILRLEKAAKGFKMLYDYTAFDENSNRIFSIEYNKTSIYGKNINLDELVTWTQVTNTWLASFLDTQQQVTFSFSLKDLVDGAENFAKGIKQENGKFRGEWSFLLTSQNFYERKFVRMRSFSLQVDCGMKVGSWNFKVNPPSKAKNEPTKQDHVGTLFLGKVNEKTYAVIPESAAPPKLYNISPIGDEHTNEGKWKIEISGSSTSGTSIKDIVDIDIHLTVALV